MSEPIVVECLYVRSGTSIYGPGAHTSAFAHFSENPNGKLVLELIDNKGGSGEISIKIGNDDKLVLSLDIKNLGYHLH